MSKKQKIYYKRKEDLENVRLLLNEAEEGLEDPKRTVKDVPESLNRFFQEKKGFLAGIGTALATFFSIFGIAYDPDSDGNDNIFSLLVSVVLSLFSGWLVASNIKKQQEIDLLHEQIALHDEIEKKLAVYIADLNSKNKKLRNLVNDKAAYIQYLETANNLSEHEVYKGKLLKNLMSVEKKIESDIKCREEKYGSEGQK